MATVHVVTIRLDAEQYEWLKAAAEELGEGMMSWVLRDIIDQARREDEGVG